MRAAEIFTRLAFMALGFAVQTPRTIDRLLDAERRYGPAWQRRAANTPRRRRQVRLLSGVAGLCLVAAGIAIALGIEVRG